MHRKNVDKIFLIIVGLLVLSGFFIFSSASLGLLTREGARMSSIMFNQIALGLVLGLTAMFVTSRVHYMHYRKYAFYIFIFALILTAMVFVPFLGMEHGGAKRWIEIGGQTFQPSELLKLAFVIYLSAWLASVKGMIKNLKYGFFPLLGMIMISGVLILKQPDTGTFLVLVIAGFCMFFVAEAKWSHIFGLIGVALAGAGGWIMMKPYVLQRITTFLNPSADSLGAGYQIKQSLIAVGSGEWFGRGFGKSIQKFNYLPEPIGDSIFAVTAEEWGFVGSVLLISLFLAFAFRGFQIASRSNSNFGRLLAVGIVILIVSQSFINMASMLGIFPLTGIPLLFVSHGGTALFITLLEVGIILNISRYQKR